MLLSIRPLTKRHVEPQHYLNKILFSLETRILPTRLGPRPSQLELHERQKVPAALRLHLYFAGWDLQHLRPFRIWLFSSLLPLSRFFHPLFASSKQQQASSSPTSTTMKSRSTQTYPNEAATASAASRPFATNAAIVRACGALLLPVLLLLFYNWRVLAHEWKHLWRRIQQLDSG